MSRIFLTRFGLIGCVGVTALALACGGNSPTSPGSSSSPTSSSSSTSSGGTGGGSGGGTGGASTPASGNLAIHLTDSPFSDAKSLLVTFSEVSVHNADTGEWKTLPFASGTARTCDLKKLNGATDVLGVGPLAAGKYTQIRLTVASADLYFDNAAAGPACAPTIARPAGQSASVTIPSGEVKLNNEFTLTSAGTTITLDFDGDQSVRQTGSGNGNGNGNGNGANGRYMMSPVIRVVSVQ